MKNYTYVEIIDDFKSAMFDAGITPPDFVEADGKLHRFHIDGHKAGSLNGAYVLHTNGYIPAGYFEDFKQGIKVTWRMKGATHREISASEREQFAAAQLLREHEQDIKRKQAAEKANKIWNFATPAVNHAYLERKKIKPHNTRINSRYGSLIIPIYNEQLKLVSLQFIGADGSKTFLKGGEKKSCFCWLGNSTDTILIAEGFATAASLHEYKGFQTFVAFDAGNLENVAKVVRANRPTAEIIIAGDNDESGVGQKAANAAALAVAGKVMIPPTIGNDWNDELTMGVMA